MAKAKQKAQLPAKRGRGRPTKYDPRYIPVVRGLVLRGLIDVEIAKMLQIDESTLYDWKLRHADFSQAMQRSKELVCDRLEATMVMRANGFERKVEKATASGRKVVINEYFPPETSAGKFLLQHRRPEVFREQREVKQLVGIEQGFLTFLQQLDDKAKLERETGNLPQLLEHQVTSESDNECG